MELKIKIFFFIDSFRIGGMHKQVLYLVTHINKDLFEPIVVTSSQEGGLRQEYEKSGCKLYDLKWKYRLNPVTFILLAKYLKLEKPDIIFITEAQNLFYYRVTRLFSWKKTIQIGSFRALTFWHGHLNKAYQILDNMFARWLYNTSCCVIVNSLAMKSNYEKVIKTSQGNPLRVIFNGSDFGFAVTKSKETLRQELELSENDIIIITIARLDPWKDFETLLDSISMVRDSMNNIKLLILGEGILRQYIERKILELNLGGNVFLMGEKKNVFDYLQIADISVLSTNGEGFSNSILESMAMGKPVIVTDVGGNTEIIGETMVNGILVPLKSKEKLAEAIKFLAENKNQQQSIGKNGQRRIRELCDLKKYISSYEKVFLDCFGNPIKTNLDV